MGKFLVRELKRFEINFVRDTYLKSCRTKGFNILMAKEYYFELYGRRFKDLMKSNTVRICVLETNPDIILSYIIYNDDDDSFKVEFLYTKFPYRKLGIGGHLFKDVSAGAVKKKKRLTTGHLPFNVSELKKINSKTKITFQGLNLEFEPEYWG